MEQKIVLHKQLSTPARDAILSNFAVIEEAIKRIRDAADGHRQKCDCCGCTLYRHFRDHQLTENLGGIMTKMRRWRDEAVRLQADEEREESPRSSREGQASDP